MRIVSLLPSTTEILFALGAGDDVVGVTFECDFPEEARSRRIVSTSAMPEGLSPREIDDWVVAAVQRGEDLYHLAADALAELDADLVITQDLCAVCAVHVSVVADALTHLGCTADVLTVDPHTLDEVFASISTIGEAVGRAQQAAALVAGLRRRVAGIWGGTVGRRHPRVLVLEWLDPPFAPGHWIPEMITLAGGVPALGVAGTASHRITWDEVRACEPDVIVCAPCGFDQPAAQAQADQLVAAGMLPPGVPVHAVDSNASWARPGPRLVDGIEDLASLLHS
ncbi:ABC transporter substrate-binding protein [Nocardioides sp.]|uniref:ABC transporter substrate-binding protein n=1 Tax=Nocardioides sp. TaxID=35761 RepID=UPI003D09FB44